MSLGDWLRGLLPSRRVEPAGPLSVPSVERRGPKPMPKVNRERRRRLMAEAFGPQARACRRLPCCVCGRTPADPHHHPSRGAGGKDCDALPLCRRCHDAAHAEGMESFQARVGVSFEVVTADLAAAIKQHECADYARVEQGGMRTVCALCERECEEPTP